MHEEKNYKEQTFKISDISPVLVLIVAILLLTVGILALFSKSLAGIPLILAGLCIFPFFWKVVKWRWKYTAPRILKIILFIVFLFLFFIMIPKTSSSTTSNTNANEPTQTTTATDTPKITPTSDFTPTPSKPLTLEDSIKNAIGSGGTIKVTEVSTETDADPITNQNLTGEKAVFVRYQMNGTYLDTDWTKKGSWSIDTDIIKKVFPLENSINRIIMVAEVPVTTAYGNNTFSTLDIVTITRSTYSQINFANFDTQNLSKIADHYSENNNVQ